MKKPGAPKTWTRMAAAVLLGAFLLMARAPAAGAEERTGHKRTLESGMTLISDTDATTATTAIQILIRGGKRAQPAGQEGLAFLATRLAVEIPDEDKIQELVGMASRFQVTVNGDYSVIQLECLSVQLEATLRILAKIVSDPLFSGLRIDSVKKHAEHQGRIEEDDSVSFGHLAALRALSGNPGYGGSIYGDKTTLSAIKGKDISEFYKRYFVAPNMILAVSSDREDAAALVENAFRSFPSVAAPPSPKTELRVPGEREISVTKETKQAFVSEAFLLPKLSPRGFVLGLLLENILGKGPGSRLWPLRAERKLAYNVNAVATQMTEGGIFEAYLETDKNKQRQALEALGGVLSGVWQSGVTEADLRSARISVWSDFLRDNEARPARTLNLASFEALGLGLDFYYGLRPELEAVSLEEFNAFIKSVLAAENSVTVVIGPAAETPPGQSSS
jgi:predicted Zn-dependent peptidase